MSLVLPLSGNDQLQDGQIDEISYLAEIGELEGGRGSNQMQNLQRAGDTRWSSHFKSICSLLRLFGPTRVVLNDIYLGRSTYSQKGNNGVYRQTLQNKSQDIVNALTLVSTTKTLLQELKDDGWESLLDKVLQELINRFSESVSELVRLSAMLDPRKIELKLELQHYELDNDPKLKNVTSLSH
ncbi:zinc finger MYM-type protein 1-like protein, partial [Tanacetum coccineum]